MSSVNQSMSLFIPRVFLNITGDRIKMAIQEYGLGQVDRVDLVDKGEYNSAYIHFKYWNNNCFVSQFQECAADPEQRCTLDYDSPWYWIVLENTSAKRVRPERRKELVNLRPNFMEQLPVAPGIVVNTIPYSVLEDLTWEMQQMQGTINELRSIILQTGFEFPEFLEENEEDMECSIEDELRHQLKNMKDEINELKEAVSSGRIVTCAVTGNKFREVLTLELQTIPEVPEVVEPKNNLVRQYCDDSPLDAQPERALSRTEIISPEFWENWSLVNLEFDSENEPMYVNSKTGETLTLSDLLERGLEENQQLCDAV
jgi:hypothetical protein